MGLVITDFGLMDLNPQKKIKKKDNMLISLIFSFHLLGDIATWPIYRPI